MILLNDGAAGAGQRQVRYSALAPFNGLPRAALYNRGNCGVTWRKGQHAQRDGPSNARQASAIFCQLNYRVRAKVIGELPRAVFLRDDRMQATPHEVHKTQLHWQPNR